METIKRPSWLRETGELILILLVVFAIRTFIFGLYQVPTGSMETTMLAGERFFADKLTPYFKGPARGDVIVINEPLFPYSKNPAARLYQEYAALPYVEYLGLPRAPQNWTKRVIGLPGEHVRGVIENGKPVIYINDKKFEEPYLNKYPLIALWRPGFVPPHSFDEQLRVAGSENMSFYSYDPSVHLSKQPFYGMDQARLLLLPAGAVIPGHTITADGKLLREPGVADAPSTRIEREGGDYWTNGDEFSVHLKNDEYWLMGDNRRGSSDSRYFGPVKRHLIIGHVLFRIWSRDTTSGWLLYELIRHPIDFWRTVRWSRLFSRVK